VTATKVTTMNNHEQPTHLVFRLLRYCTANAISSCPSTYICDRESRSPESSSSAILHRERVNKVFEKRSSRLFTRFFKFFITARLPLRRTRAEGHRLPHELRQADHRLHPIVVVKEPQVTYDFFSQIMSRIFNMLIRICMILLDNQLQCLLFVAMLDLFRTYCSIATLIYSALV
jgi:hypothetical protein